MKKQMYLVLITIIILVSSGCSSDTGIKTIKQYVFSEKYKSSCWIGITPGYTSKKEALAIISRTYTNSGEEVNDDDLSFIQWLSYEEDSSSHGTITVVDDRVLDIYVFLKEQTIPVADLLNGIGNPQYVGLSNQPTIRCSTTSLMYPGIGLVAHITPYSGQIGPQNEQYVEWLMILSPWVDEERTFYDIYEIPWNGFGDYCPEE